MSKGKQVLALTGGTGFVGRHLLDMAIAAGHPVRALTRTPKPAEPGVTWVHGALDNRTSLAGLAVGSEAVIHVAGLINGSKSAFETVNIGGTAAMIEAAQGAGIRRFVHISSLAAREPGLSDYGRSKAESERIVQGSGLDWTIIRPPAIFGPGDREMLELFKMARRGFVALPPRGRFSVIQVEDLCRLILAVVASPEAIGQIYEPDDGRENGWDNRHFARSLGRLFGKRATTVSLPKVALRGAARLDRLLRRGNAKLTADRVGYFCHPDWVVKAERRPPPELWQPQLRTPSALKATADWYRQAGWLR
jgi:uncharacterized protein YbjT (DUF2867 family)